MNVKKIQLVDEDLNDIKFETVAVPDSCKAPAPTITVTGLCRFKMHALAKSVYKEFHDRRKEGALETFAFLLGSRMGFAEDIVIPEQEASGTLVSVNPESAIAIKPEIVAKNAEREKTNVDIRAKNAEITKKNEQIRVENAERAKRGEPAVSEEKLLDELKPIQIVGWTHSHNTMSAFSSGTDDANHKRMHNELVLTDLKKEADKNSTTMVPSIFHVIGITVNIRNEECAVFYASHPCGFEHQFTGAEVVEVDEIDLTKEQMQAIIIPIIDEVRKKVKTRRSYSYSWAPRGSTPVTRTLDNYICRRDSEISNAVNEAVGTSAEMDTVDVAKKIDDETSLENIVKFKGVLDKIVSIQKACGGKESKTWTEVKDLVRGIMESERDFIVKIAGEIFSKKKPDIENFIVFDHKKVDVGKEPDDKSATGEKQSADDTAITTKCSNCGKAIGDDGDEKDRESGKTGADGGPICVECATWNDDLSICSECKCPLIEGENFVDDEDDNGNPLCSSCASLAESIKESDTMIEEQEVNLLDTSKHPPKDPVTLKPGES